MIRVETFAQFAIRLGLVDDHDVEGEIHGNLGWRPGTKSHARRTTNRLRELMAARDAAKAQYRAEVAAGRVREPEPSLEAKAAGHDDNPSVQAARSVLAKRAARKAAA